MGIYYFSGSTIVWSGTWPLSLLKHNVSVPLDNETYVEVTNPIVALGNVQLQWCEDFAPEKGLCITSAEECVLSLCARQFETSVVNGTANTTITNEDYGCLSQIHDDTGTVAYGTSTHCWQAGKPRAELQMTNVTGSYDWEDRAYQGLDFCSDGIVVQDFQKQTDDSLASTLAVQSVQANLLTRLIGNRTTRSDSKDYYSFLRDNLTTSTASSYTMEYITENGLGPVLSGIAASLTQQALLANNSEKLAGTVYTTETFVAVDWPWLIYPATLVLAAIILLILTAIHSHRCRLRIWKSSMLPLLYRTLDPDLLGRQPVLHDVSTMTGVAGRAKVTLVETSREDGVVLTQ